MKENMTIGEIVALDFRTASVFKEAGIDFCCGGKMGIDETCSEKGIDKNELIDKLEKLKDIPDTSGHNFIDWDPAFLCDYIVNTHHKYVLKTMPELVIYTEKIATVHGERHSELRDVADLFSQINKELIQHLKNEEEVLFPSIRQALNSGSENAKTTILSEISRLSEEHEFAGGAMDKINVLTSNYKVPQDGCNTYTLAFKLTFDDYKKTLDRLYCCNGNFIFSITLFRERDL